MIKSFFMMTVFVSLSMALDLNDVSKAVDFKAAKDSIKKEEAKKAMAKGKNITMEDVANSFDKEKAKKAIKKDEMKKLFKF